MSEHFRRRGAAPSGLVGFIGLLLGVGLALAACTPADWRPSAIAGAQAKIRQDLADPVARFSRIQVTGDAVTGQTCGYVTAKAGQDAGDLTGRFIVYIDATAGPYVEGGRGKADLSQEDFDRAWQADCVAEGYRG